MKTTTQLQTTGNATITKATVLTSLTLGLFLLAGLPTTAQADPLDKSSPKIAHGMYRDRGKSSPKIAHGMYRDRGKSSPKIAHGMYRDRGKSSPKIAHGMYKGRGKSVSLRSADANGDGSVNISDPSAKLDLEDAIFLALEMGEFEIADALLKDLAELVSSRDGGPSDPIDGVWF